MIAAIQRIEAHIAETAALMDKSGQLKTAIQPSKPGTPDANGRLRTDVQQPGAGQGAQPDRLRQGSQESNSRKAGTGSAQATKVANLTGG